MNSNSQRQKQCKLAHIGVQGSAVDALASKPQAHRLLFQELHTVTFQLFANRGKESVSV